MNMPPLLMGLFQAALTFAVVLLAITFSLPHGWSGWQRLQQSGRQMQATIVSCQGSGKHRSMSYTYTVDAHPYTGTGAGCQGIGSEVALVYLPDDPSVSALQYSQDMVKWLLALALVMTGVSGFAASWVANRRRLRAQGESPDR
jgi:hypothetical protein